MKIKIISISKKHISRIIILAMMNFLVAIPAIAQDNVQLSISSNTDLSFEGTSNVHDWSSEVTEITGRGAFNKAIFNGSNVPGNPVADVMITIPVKEIESGKNKMNDIMYDALKAEDHPTIEYKLIGSKLISETGNEFTLETQGYLTVAGVKKQVGLQIKGKKIDDDTLQFTGSKKLKMTDFDVDPPKALFGAIKSGNEVVVHLTAIFSR